MGRPDDLWGCECWCNGRSHNYGPDCENEGHSIPVLNPHDDPPTEEPMRSLAIDQFESTDLTRERNRRLPCDRTKIPCHLCDKPMAETDKTWYIHVVNGGIEIAHADDPSDADTSGDCGWHPIGNDCARRVPVTHRRRLDLRSFIASRRGPTGLHGVER